MSGPSEVTTVSQLSAQWTNPSDVLSLLLIIGGDIVQTALAQTAGGYITPVCFSFGWVAYSFSTFIRVYGDGRLLPAPDFPVKVFNLETSYVRENRNWVIGRILRDNEVYMNTIKQHGGAAIRISIYYAKDRRHNRDTRNLFTLLAWTIITLLQIGISAIPLGLDGEWGVFLVTCSGIVAAFLAGALPQWRLEKVPIRKQSRKYIALTSGNGSRDIMIIYGAGKALDLEELAAGESPRSDRMWESFELFSRPIMKDGQAQRYKNGTPKRRTQMFKGLPLGLWLTRVASSMQVVFWLVLLITVAGLRSHSWYLVAVGSIGMLQNAMLAAAARKPGRRGLPLTLADRIINNSVMDGLMDLEITIRGAGQGLRDEFFPGSLKGDEALWWDGVIEEPMNTDLMHEYDERRWLDPDRGRPRSRIDTNLSVKRDIPDISFGTKRWMNRRPSTMSAIPEFEPHDTSSPSSPARTAMKNHQSPKTWQGDPTIRNPKRANSVDQVISPSWA